VTRIADPSEGAQARLELWVRPASSRRSVEWDRWRGRWNVSVRSAAKDGAANQELREFLAETLGVSLSQVRIVRGQASHAKTVEVVGLGAVSAIERLSGYAEPPPRHES
jgi:uncharacterized protein (TIGR00251 family)